MKLLDAVSANGDGASFSIKSNSRVLEDSYTFYAWGTFGGGTVVAQASLDGTTWFNIPTVSLTADGMVIVQGLRLNFIRGSLSGATAPSVSLQVM